MSRYTPPLTRLANTQWITGRDAAGTADFNIIRLNGQDYAELGRPLIGIQDRGGQVHNVKAYGAVGDGVADDTAAIASAIAANRIVVLPPGTYLVTGGLGGAASNVTFIGAGAGATILKLANGANTHLFDISGSGWRIRDIEIDGNRANNTAGHGIRISGIDHHIDRCIIHDTAGYGLGIAQGTGESFTGILSNVRTYNTGADGIDIKDKVSANGVVRLHNVSVTAFNLAAAAGSAGIDCRGPVQLSNIVVVGAGAANSVCLRFREISAGTGPRGAAQSTLTNFHLTGPDDGTTSSYGISLNAADIAISNGYISGCWRGYVDQAAPSRLSVANVVVEGAWSRGFEINSDGRAKFSQCHATGCDTGFYVAGDDVTLNACGIDACTTTGFNLVGLRPVLIAPRLLGSGGTGLSFGAGAANWRVLGGEINYSAGTPLANAATGGRSVETVGYVTVNGGTASVADAGTISHGLATTPTRYSVTPTVAGRVAAVTAVSATTLTIALQDNAGAAITVAENVVWRAEV